MPAPRRIKTSNRKQQIESIQSIASKLNAKVGTIVNDLSKDHVDDKKAAKTLLATATKLQKAFATAATA